MKKLNSLRLNQFSKTEIGMREMNSLKGGRCACICFGENCGCLYYGEQCSSGDDYWGGSSLFDNTKANGDPSGLCANIESNQIY